MIPDQALHSLKKPSQTNSMFLFLEPFEQELKKLTGIQFDSYDPEFLTHRIRERMLALNIERQADYLKRLRTSPKEAGVLLKTTGINVSEFFRNPLLYEFLEDRILPELLWQKNTDRAKSIRIWSAGCAGGEEPYSIAMLLCNLLHRQLDSWHIDIFATDISPDSLSMATAGIYEIDRLREVKLRNLQSYFTAEGSRYRIKDSIRNMVSFSQEDLATKQRYAPAESIFGAFDIVLCRNVMIYFNPKARNATFTKLSRALCRGGYLILGESEGLLSEEKKMFSELDWQNRILVKK